MIAAVRAFAVGVWAVLAVAVVLLGLRTVGVPLLDPDESRFARTSLEMSRSGDLVVPTFEGEQRLVKPPLLHWLQSALFLSFGPTAWIARLPAVLATLASILFVAWIAAQRFGGESSTWTAAVFVTMPLVLAIGGLGTLDALLSVHVLAILALDVVDPEGADDPRALALGCLLGVCFLIKGPVGVVLPALMMLAGRTCSGREVVPRLRIFFLALAAGVAVVAPWVGALVARVGLVPLVGVMRREALERYFAGTDHVQPAWFYLAVVLAAFFPWAGVAVVAIVRAALARRDPATRTARYLGGAFLAGLVFFSLGRSKLVTYVLPLAPFVALLSVWELGHELSDPARRRAGRIVLTVSLALAAAMALLHAPHFADDLGRGTRIAGIVLGLGAAIAAVGLALGRPRLTHGAAAGAMLGTLLTALLVVLPPIARMRTSAYLVEAVPELHDPSRPLVVMAMKVPSLSFYLDRVPEEVPVERLGPRLAELDDPLVVCDQADVPDIDDEARSRLVEIGRAGKYVVYRKLPSLDAPPGPG
jgi:4-amino-4-deoxy-L-arabinose transferase-like glycosyltransferase